jgi:hypothetical protein
MMELRSVEALPHLALQDSGPRRVRQAPWWEANPVVEQSMAASAAGPHQMEQDSVLGFG